MNIVTFLGQASPYYDSTYSATDSAVAAGVSVFFILFFVGLIALLYVITSFLMSRIFKKAGVESWKAWIPVYSNWIMLELGGQKGFWAIITLIPFFGVVGAIFMIIAMYRIGVKFGKDDVFVLLAIFLPIVWMAWLAFDSSTWKGSVAASATPPAPGAPTTPSKPQ